MGYRYSALHNTILHDGKDDDRRDGILKDGERMRVKMTMMDSGGVQQSVAMEDARRRSAEDRALYNLDVSNRWRGGLAAIPPGDVVTVGDQQGVVASHDDGKLVIKDASKLDAETLKQEAYDAYDHDIQNSWMNTRDDAAVVGGECTTAGRESGTWRRRQDGKLVCVPDKSSKPDEFAIAGPLSDEQRVQVRDRMYQDYEDQIQNAWRR